MLNKTTKTPVLTVPKGYDLDDMFDTDDSEFNEQPITEEVIINFERDSDRKESSV